ncbi:8981_t:CDS:1, partial [Scutellospora calospora]
MYSDFYPVSVRNWQNNHPLPKQIPNISVWQLPQQDLHKYSQLHDPRHQPERPRDKGTPIGYDQSYHPSSTSNESNQSISTQRNKHKKDLGKSSSGSSTHITSQNDREKTPLQQLPTQTDISILSSLPSRPESESGESQQALSDAIDSTNKRKSTSNRKKSPNSDKSRSLRSVTRATLGNRFIVYEPKVGQDDDIIGNINELNSVGGNDNIKTTNTSHSNIVKRGRKNKSEVTSS